MTIKASEVRKGMRVRFGSSNGDAEITTEGVVTEVSGEYAVSVWFGSYCLGLNPDHPVTVLAEPEPEWVEGAWYRVEINGNKTIARRVEGGWVRLDGVDYPSWEDIDRSRVVTVLGRVLIVDWPGDDVARDIVHNSVWTNTLARTTRVTYDLTRDAIRTQGGAR